MRIDVNYFHPVPDITLKQREAFHIVVELLKEKGFECVVYKNNLKDCIFLYKEDAKQYRFHSMEYWNFNNRGERGLDIDFIRMEEIGE